MMGDKPKDTSHAQAKTPSEIALQDFDIIIKSDGRWFHEGGEIKRLGLVKLFASVLSCDEAGRYWLTTPVEKGEIQVEDAPFVIVSLRREGVGKGQSIYLTDNLDVEYKLSAQTPLVMRKPLSGAKNNDEAKPYLLLDKGLSCLIKHAVFYEMADIALEMIDEADDKADNEAGALRLWSDGQPFALMASDDGA